MSSKPGGSGKTLAAQVNLAREGLQLQDQQFSYIKNLLAPYAKGGRTAFAEASNLIGLGTDAQQQDAIYALENSPYFSGLVAQGENALLQNASATGGLRGGNTQAALAQFRPNMLNQAIQQQFANLTGLSQQGLAAGSSLGGVSQNFTNAATNLYGNMMDAYGQRQAAKNAQGGGLGGALSVVGTGLGLASGLGWAPFAAQAVGASGVFGNGGNGGMVLA